jgi:ABC-2 type transport system ATP-binding protein
VSETAIVTERLDKTYGGRGGIRGLGLQVRAGEIYGFLGPNGAGKTTTIRILLGLLRPTAGWARVLGRDAWRESPAIKAETGYIPGDLRLYAWMTARSALRSTGAVRGRDLLRPGMELVERFRLEPDVAVHRMSRGMRQKLGLVLALAHSPRLLVLDEPTTALDPPMQQTLYDVLHERAREGATVFFSSHTLGEVEALCERVGVVREGRLVSEQTLHEMRLGAGRSVDLVWANAAAAASTPAPPFLTLDRREALRWRCTLAGPVMELVRWCGEQPLVDVNISSPDLDRLFRAFYAESGK